MGHVNKVQLEHELVELEHVSDAVMYLFFEKDITDRDSDSWKTYSQVSNKYL